MTSQVVSLELAKRLKELDVPQESLWEWVGTPYSDGRRWLILRRERLKQEREFIDIYSAFTVAELGQILPANIGQYFLDTTKESANQFYCSYVGGTWGFETLNNKCFRDKTEANVRAKMLIWLKENKLI